MSNSDHSPIPARPMQPLSPRTTRSEPDPADLGTAYGMEMSIGNSAPAPAPVPTTAVDIDLDDPLGWIRRWVARHKPA